MSAAVDYLRAALRDSCVVELRHNTGPGEWLSGRFDHEDPLRAAIRARCRTGNLYISLNRPADRACSNRMADRPLSDVDISHVCRIPVDFDPVRPAGTMATEAELQTAIRARDRFVSAMLTADWPMPALGMSGSGAHAVYRCLLRASDRLRDALDAIFEGWRRDFATPGIGFDIKVRNPSRIFRLYGTMNRKGENTPERPYRRSSVWIPEAWQIVTTEALKRTAQRYARRAPAPAPQPQPRIQVDGRIDLATLDAPGWFAAHGLYKRPLRDNKHAVTCPWADTHSEPDHPRCTDTVLLPRSTSAGWTFYCSHAHCEGRGLHDVLSLWNDASAFCVGAAHA